jgi:hypothetical protein
MPACSPLTGSALTLAGCNNTSSFGGVGVENLAQSRLHAFFHPARRMFSSGTSDPNPVQGGGEIGGAGWARGPLSAARLTLRRLHSSHLSRPVMALQTATALQRRSEPSRRSTRRREMNAMSRASRRFPPLLLRFPAPLPAINSSSPRR